MRKLVSMICFGERNPSYYGLPWRGSYEPRNGDEEQIIYIILQEVRGQG
jgi:hypothetical protein